MTRPFKGDVLVFDGMHSRVIALPEIKLVIKIFPINLRENALKEFKALLMAEGRGIDCVPKPIDLVDGPSFVALLREYIEGEYLVDYIKRVKALDFKSLVSKILKCLRQFDKIGITIDELSTPRKNIVVSGGKPYIIDLERWSYGSKTTNITRFLGFLVRMTYSNTEIGKVIESIWSKEKLLKVSKDYKESRDYGKLMKDLGLEDL